MAGASIPHEVFPAAALSLIVGISFSLHLSIAAHALTRLGPFGNLAPVWERIGKRQRREGDGNFNVGFHGRDHE
jgi:hypothetical protein